MKKSGDEVELVPSANRSGDRGGAVLRMNNQQNPRIALTCAPEGKRTRGRPKVTWRRTVEGERQKLGFAIWTEAVTTARNRAGWRRQVNGPILPEETGNKSSKSLLVLMLASLVKTRLYIAFHSPSGAFQRVQGSFYSDHLTVISLFPSPRYRRVWCFAFPMQRKYFMH